MLEFGNHWHRLSSVSPDLRLKSAWGSPLNLKSPRILPHLTEGLGRLFRISEDDIWKHFWWCFSKESVTLKSTTSFRIQQQLIEKMIEWLMMYTPWYANLGKEWKDQLQNIEYWYGRIWLHNRRFLNFLRREVGIS